MKRHVRILLLLPLTALIACGPHSATMAEAAQSGSFTVTQLSKPVGTASFQFTPTRQGYNSTSVVRVSMKGLDYALSKTEQLSSANQLEHVQLSATINTSAVNVTAAPDAAQLLLNISANGRSTTTRLAAHPAAVFLPDVDPGALETLLALAVAHNNRDVWAIIPKEAGSVEPVQLATYPDEQGTLDGKPISVHHMVATIGKDTTDLFSGPANQLLQAELREPGFALVRQGFVLKPPAKPIAPPVMPSAPPNGTAGQQYPQQYPQQGQQQQNPQQYQQNQYPPQQYPQQQQNQYPPQQYPQQQQQ